MVTFSVKSCCVYSFIHLIKALKLEDGQTHQDICLSQVSGKESVIDSIGAPPNSHMEALNLTTSECDYIWREGL